MTSPRINGSKAKTPAGRAEISVTVNGFPVPVSAPFGSPGEYIVPLPDGIVGGGSVVVAKSKPRAPKGKPKLKVFIVLEVITSIEAESKEAARAALPHGRRFELREVSK